MGVEIPAVFEFHGEVIDAEGVRWAAMSPALTRYFTDKMLHWIADAMEKAEENSVASLDSP